MKRILITLLGLGTIASASAQISLGKEGKGGQLMGSFETNSIYYVDDDVLGSHPQSDLREYIGSNSYLKLDYSIDRFSVGVQGDFYLPAIDGYEIGTTDEKGKRDLQFLLSGAYAQWLDKSYSVRIGSIFEQFGNGLIYRSFEDRQLGINNSLLGATASYHLNNYFTIKALYGAPRLLDSWADSRIGGADLSISLSELFKSQTLNLSIEGSWVNRYEDLSEDVEGYPADGFVSKGMGNSLNMYSGRLNMDIAGVTLRTEYVHKSKDLGTIDTEQAVAGYAAFAELGYNYKGFSFSAQGRVLENMGTRLSLYNGATVNQLNYLPALTRQYTYMLANLEPHQVNVEGEIAGQVDLYYSLRNKSDRRKYWNFHLNYSTAYTLHKEQSITGNRERIWQDLNFDVERQWNKSWKTTLLYSFQEWSPSHGHQHRTYVANIFVADVTYKINRKHSLRWELQYLLTDDYQGDWVAGLVEYNFAPRWSIYFQNMYNLESEPNFDDKKPLDENFNPLKVYYYNGGFSFTHNRTRVQLSYGRNRAGYICSGGVCRYTPAYTGVNLQLSTSF